MKLEEMVSDALTRDPRLPAVEFGRQWYDWGDMRRVADRVAGLVDASGAPSNAPIVLAPRTRPSAAAALLGLVARGTTIRMAYVFQSAAGIIRDIDKGHPAVVIAAASDFSGDIVSTLRERGIAGIALSEMDAQFVPGLETSTAQFDRNAPARHIVTLTSGTTGAPKTFPVSFDVISEHLIGSSMLFAGKLASGEQLTPIFLPAPLGNISGIYGIFPTTVRGHPLVLVDRFNVPEWHDYVMRYRPQFVNLPAASVQTVLDANIPRDDVASIKAITSGAAPLDPSVHRAFVDRYGIPILLSYGATEFVGPITLMTLELHEQWGERKFGTVGRVVKGAEIRAVHPETGAILPPGKEGLLEARTERMGPDWIRTTDLVVIDEDGFMFHRGRADGAINRGGFKLLPETIEQALMLHGAVSASIVIGVEDRRLGQVPAVLIQLKPGLEQPSIAELEKHLREYVLATHVPTIWRFVDQLPRTPSMKFDRRAARTMLEERQLDENSG